MEAKRKLSNGRNILRRQFAFFFWAILFAENKSLLINGEKLRYFRGNFRDQFLRTVLLKLEVV